MADALDDDFVASSPSLAGAGGSDAGSVAGDVVDLDASFALDGEEGESSRSRAKAPSGGTAKDRGETTSGKKRKRRDKEKERKAKKVAAHVEVSTSVASRPPDMQADYLRSCARKVGGYAKMSEMELDEIAVREASLIDTSSFGKKREQETLSDFVLQYFPSLKKELSQTGDKAPAAVSGHGSPALVVVTGNAQRAADLSRSLRALASEITGVQPEPKKGSKPPKKKSKKGDTKEEEEEKGEGDEVESSNAASTKALTIGKLFGRHFKLAEHVAWLASHPCPLAVGTPQRLLDLVDKEALKLDQLRVLLLDCTWLDSKARNLLDGPETREATVKLLAHEKVGSRLRSSKGERARVVLF